MRIYITGGSGLLGQALRRELNDEEVVAPPRSGADITDSAGLIRHVTDCAPDAVIHCAAATAVDWCESHADEAYCLNALGSANVANACRRCGCRLIAISTDYVFDGTLPRPYHEFDRATGGRTVYGQSKFAGEEAIRRLCPDHLICRTAWLYGPDGPNFARTILQRLHTGNGQPLRVVSDQFGNPTSTAALASHLRLLLRRPELTGTFHLSCEGEASWYEFACFIARHSGLATPRILPCTTAEFPRPAPRPANSRLEKRMLRLCGLPPMPHWHEALADFLSREHG